jgi:hypothetical protein
MGILREISQEKDFANVENILSQPGLVIKSPDGARATHLFGRRAGLAARRPE